MTSNETNSCIAHVHKQCCQTPPESQLFDQVRAALFVFTCRSLGVGRKQCISVTIRTLF